MTRISRWIGSLNWWQLNPKARGGVLPRLWWLLEARVYWGWSWPVCNGPSLWVNWRWLEWSRNCLPSNWFIPVDRSWSPSKGLSIGVLVRVTIEDHRRACNRLLWRLNKRHSFSRRPRRRGGGLASSIFGSTICESSQCQNARPDDRHGDD